MIVKMKLLILLALALCVSVTAQVTFTPRDADESEAWTIYQQFKESKKKESTLESSMKQKFGDSVAGVYGMGGIFAVDREAKAQSEGLKIQVEAERKRQAELEAVWEK